jgi:hypothetical protein
MASIKFQAVLSPAVVNTVVQAEQSFVVGPGGFDTDASVVVTKPTVQSGGTPTSARVIDATHIGITWTNPTAGGVTPTASEAYQFVVTK